MRLDKIKAGYISNTHGLRGEVRIQPRDNDPDFLLNCETWLLDGQEAIVPTAKHLHKSFILAKFPGIDDIDRAAEKLKGRTIYVRRKDIDLDYCDDELLGLAVYDADRGNLVGELTRVDFYPAHKIYTVTTPESRTFMIPAVQDIFITSIDVDTNRMEVHLWEGLQ